ncbi:MAG TPA: HPr(Ser) kinase/phosphatase [Candidatus Wallbacteria bacterium]|nr:HPr(Ser) kinase/phosphatase [Candidatus Wallbacteria bacterium]
MDLSRIAKLNDEKLTLKQLVTDMSLSVLTEGKLLQNAVLSPEVIKPGLELAGYYKNLTFDKIMVFGKHEISYLENISYDLRLMRLHELFLYHIPCIILADYRKPYDDLLNVANQFSIPVLYTVESCNKFMFSLTNYLEAKFSPKKILHGTLVEIYNMGVLILGDSGTGKSETALELIRRGHCLVCDDVVTLRKISHNEIFGYTDPLLKYHVEVRGLGILDIQALFGAALTIPSKEVDLVIELVPSSNMQNREFDRLGMSNEYHEVMGVKIHKIAIPVQEGRNIAIIIEVAVMNERLKKQGHNSSQIFIENLFKKINPTLVSDLAQHLPEPK